MAESVVSIVNNVNQHIASTVSTEASVLLDLDNQANALREDLQGIQNYLIDAEAKGELVENEQVRAWLADLRSIAYEAEDVIDTYISEVTSKWHHRLFSQVPGLFSRASKSKELQKLRDRIQEVMTRLKRYGISSSSLRWCWTSQVTTQSHLFTCHADWLDPTMYVTGLEEDIESLVGVLTRRDSSGVQGVAIVGMVGSGKTILASRLYNHQTIKESFDQLLWVSLSQGWDFRAILVEVLTQARGGWKGCKIASQAQSEQELLDSLTTVMEEKSFLVVLDDVWSTRALDRILQAFKASQRSKIMITSQKQYLPGPSEFWYMYKTRCLTEDEGWRLFEDIAFKHLPRTDKSEILGKHMMRKCDGLPLLIASLGKILSTKDSVEEWERVFSNMEGSNAYLYKPVNDILALCYNDLPNDLKLCFLYLGLFPQGRGIPTGELIKMWIAEGFVKPESSEQSYEVAGMKCVQKLIDRSMVQVTARNYLGDPKVLQLHDIMRDLCIMKGMELDFLSTFFSNSAVTARQARRAATNVSMGFDRRVKNPHLRSLLLSGRTNYKGEDDYTMKEDRTKLNLLPICEYFRLLRVLDIVGIETCDGTLPEQMGNLIHLRYLRIKSTNIRVLPKSIGRLRNLMTLDYWDVYIDNNVEVPNVLWKLDRLNCLYLPYEMSTKEEFKLHTLRNLQVLWGIGGGNWMLKEMKLLSSDLKKLCIQGISRREQLDAVFDCPSIKSVDRLSILALDWYGFELDSLEPLESRKGLLKLRLMGRAKEILMKPFQFPQSLRKLDLYYTQFKEEETMVILGELPFLKFLKLCKDSFLGIKWVCHEKAFPKLEDLRLFNLPCLDEWKIEKGAMPCLKKLSIALCLNLKRVPEGLKSITTLKRLEIERMLQSFCSRIQQVRSGKTPVKEGEDYHIVRHIPDIRIQDPCAFFR